MSVSFEEFDSNLADVFVTLYKQHKGNTLGCKMISIELDSLPV